jgi:transcriptional regulator with XRE-family HTH domain
MKSTNAEKRKKNQGEFPLRLRQLRKQKGITQTEIAKLAGVHETHIGRYERGMSRPSAHVVKRLADALGVSADYLIEGSTEDAAKAKFEDRELLRQFQEVQTLPEEDKVLVKRFLNAFLVKKKIEEMAVR